MNYNEDFGNTGKVNIKDGKHMEWWYFVPIILAVVMFLLVGTIFEKRIEQRIRNFLESHLPRNTAENISTESTGNQANLPNSTRGEPNTQTPQKPCDTCSQEAKNTNSCQEIPKREAQDNPNSPTVQESVLVAAQNPIQTQEPHVLAVQQITQDITAQGAQDSPMLTDVRPSLSKSAVRMRSRHLAPEIH